MKRKPFSSQMSISSQYFGSMEQENHNLEENSLKRQNQHLKKQNQLLKKQLQQVKTMSQHSKKELDLYRKIVLEKQKNQNTNNNDNIQTNQLNEVFEMQHQRIFDLQTQLQILQEKYNRSLNNTGSRKETQYAVKCKQLEKKLQQTQIHYQKEISYLNQKIIRMTASQIIQKGSKRLPTSPSTQLKPLSGNNRRLF